MIFPLPSPPPKKNCQNLEVKIFGESFLDIQHFSNSFLLVQLKINQRKEHFSTGKKRCHRIYDFPHVEHEMETLYTPNKLVIFLFVFHFACSKEKKCNKTLTVVGKKCCINTDSIVT